MELVTKQTLTHLRESDFVYLRTSRHPSAGLAEGAISFDAVYDDAESFAEVYRAISDQIVEAAQTHGDVTYCVPGSPLVLERSVQHLRQRSEVDVRLLPAVSFLDEVWSRLSVDPVDDGVRLIDGHRFAVEAAGERGPLLVAHAHAQWVLSEIKLALMEEDALTDDQTITVLQRLGTTDELIFEVAWHDLDRVVEADHLTSLYLPQFAAPTARSLAGSVELMRRLRLECPWDRSQNHASLRRFLLEETYEVVDALDRVVELTDVPVVSDEGQARTAGESVALASESQTDEAVLIDAYADLESELGDLLFQVLFHSRLASEAGQFGLSDVAQTLIDKMVLRHPHVFGGRDPSLYTSPEPADSFAVHDEREWERMKAEQTDRRSVLDDIPRAMPALSRSSKVLKRAVGAFGPPMPGPRLESLLSTGVVDADLGPLLLAVVEVARRQGVDPELALREAVAGLERSIRVMEVDGIASARSNWVIG